MSLSMMRAEINEIPDAVERLLSQGWQAAEKAADAARERDPAVIMTVARGSSDHVSTYLKYLAEIMLGVPVASVGPSVASVYGARVRMDRGLCLAVSQSGQSPDLVSMVGGARDGGGLTLAITNDSTSPVAQASDHVMPIMAGPENSVAATKTFVTSAVAGALMLALWRGDGEFLAAIRSLPQALDRALMLDWDAVRVALRGQRGLYTLGRGPSWATSNEAALKFKEVAGLHASSYSSAELLHGPVSIVQAGFPVLALVSSDASEAPAREVCAKVAAQGGQVFATSPAPGCETLPRIRTGHPFLDPLALITGFYGMVEAVAQDKGLNPDEPPHLKKVTETV